MDSALGCKTADAALPVSRLNPASPPQARYHVFNFKHNHEGDNLESIVFVYSCPGYSCSIKVGPG